MKVGIQGCPIAVVCRAEYLIEKKEKEGEKKKEEESSGYSEYSAEHR